MHFLIFLCFEPSVMLAKYFLDKIETSTKYSSWAVFPFSAVLNVLMRGKLVKLMYFQSQ